MTESIPAVTAHDIAAELRRRLPGVGVVKLHKLLYYAQGWHLAWVGEPMFADRIEAWVNGPVVAKLWADEKYGRLTPDPRPVEGNHSATLNYVVERYGGFTGSDLIRLTHGEAPWRDLSEDPDASTGPSPEITREALRSWFERDEELIARNAEVEHLRRNRHAYSFAPLPDTPEIRRVINDALSGPQIREARPQRGMSGTGGGGTTGRHP